MRTILDKEFTNQQISISNGIYLIYFLVENLKVVDSSGSINYDTSFIVDKMMNSDIWDKNINISQGLLTGLPGPLLVLSLINKQRED